MNIRSLLVNQFHRPRGMLGRIAGWIMSTRNSNLARNAWAVGLLDVKSAHCVLELGPGPGVTLGKLLEAASAGEVTAIDHSALMLDACRKRHQKAVDLGRLRLVESTFSDFTLDSTFDRILAVNALQFDAERQDTFCRLAGILDPGGKLVVVFQPRSANATAATTERWAARIAELMTGAGFSDVFSECLPLDPVQAMAVIGSKR